MKHNSSTPNSSSKAPLGRRERKLQITLDTIADTSWAMFQSQGYEVVTMEQIALAADVAKGTLYKHFPAKEAIIDYKFSRDRLQQAEKTRKAVLAHKSCAARLQQRLTIESRYIESQRPFIAAYLQYSLSGPGLVRRHPSAGVFEAFIIELITAGQAAGEIKSTQSAEHLTEYLSALRLASLIRWLRNPKPSLVNINRDMLQVFLSGAAI
jgi:AcrR family transcriptional regulator